MFSKEEIALAKGTVKAIKKISKGKWEWKPEEGDHIVLDDEVYLLFPTRDGLGYDAGISCGRSTDYFEEKYYDDFTQATKDNCIPLLPWEKIEEILEGVGYGFGVWRTFEGFTCEMYWLEDNPNQDPCVIIEKAKSRQLAVMRAVIELGKEKANEKD